MRVTFITYHLGAGGAERVTANMANYWVARGHPVHVVTLATSHPSFFALEPSVEVRHLGVAAESGNALTAIGNNARRLTAIRRAVRESEPDAVISFELWQRRDKVPAASTHGSSSQLLSTPFPVHLRCHFPHRRSHRGDASLSFDRRTWRSPHRERR